MKILWCYLENPGTGGGLSASGNTKLCIMELDQRSEQWMICKCTLRVGGTNTVRHKGSIM